MEIAARVLIIPSTLAFENNERRTRLQSCRIRTPSQIALTTDATLIVQEATYIILDLESDQRIPKYLPPEISCSPLDSIFALLSPRQWCGLRSRVHGIRSSSGRYCYARDAIICSSSGTSKRGIASPCTHPLRCDILPSLLSRGCTCFASLSLEVLAKAIHMNMN